MLKQKILFIAIFLIASVLITGCSWSDGSSTSEEEILVIDGHTLPPDPGEAGKETLLGIDVNENGVRDDMEIYIYKRFRDFENSRKDRAIALQYAKATQIIIQEPEKAYERNTYKVMDDAIDCQWYYYKQHLKNIQDYHLRLQYRQEHRIYDEEMQDVIFNTRERLEAYMDYNDALSGHVFDSRPKIKEKCDVDIDTLGNE